MLNEEQKARFRQDEGAVVLAAGLLGSVHPPHQIAFCVAILNQLALVNKEMLHEAGVVIEEGPHHQIDNAIKFLMVAKAKPGEQTVADVVEIPL